MFKNPTDTAKWENFNYRAGYNLEKAREWRDSAKDHMGKHPYGAGW